MHNQCIMNDHHSENSPVLSVVCYDLECKDVGVVSEVKVVNFLYAVRVAITIIPPNLSPVSIC